jgi:hypothetical protein
MSEAVKVTIDSLKPNVSLEEARRLMSTDGIHGMFRYLRLGRFRWITQFYIPFDIFDLKIHRSGVVESGFIAVDAVNGTLDPYAFERPPLETDCVTLDTRNTIPRLLTLAASQKNAEERVRRLLYQRGFFRIADLKIIASRRPFGIAVPYWVGFFGSEAQLRMAVIDAVRRRVEGAKVRTLLQQWFTGALAPAGANQVAAAS